MMHRKLMTVLTVSVAMTFAGCQTGKPGGNSALESMNPLNMKLFNDSEKQEIPAETPHRMAVIWKDATISDIGKPTTRGFGGRVYFYNEKQEPVKVHGELVVYGYDDSDGNESSAADRKYVIEQASLPGHYSKTDLGHSYSIWIPWDQAGGLRKTVSLVPIFKDSTGQIVKGGHSINVLPGKVPVDEQVAQVKLDDAKVLGPSSAIAGRPDQTWKSPHAPESISRRFAGAQVNHVTMTESTKSPGLRTTTIKLPQRLGRQIQQSASLHTPPANPHADPAPTPDQEATGDLSPLMKQLQSQNQVTGSTQVSYGQLPWQKSKSDAETAAGSAATGQSTPATTSTGDASPRSPFTKPRQRTAFGQPGAIR